MISGQDTQAREQSEQVKKVYETTTSGTPDLKYVKRAMLKSYFLLNWVPYLV
ncbi:hypothetical protein OQX61_09030 [Pedobacter sp. PLR]|uniref:hypothetical protein n=1 Tax=Pedobacter sp. PLR TaxID=2994465 RepID=UPI0022455D00|nr:hypothetical protein [Pedobacter sp. PLR]MCX2451413.1 hypothetical protein [Pedobacter sp. PLR]